MAQFRVHVKPTSGGDKLSVDVEGGMTVAELKEAIATASSVPAAEQRVIYKGQVLKNERTVDSYGIQAEHVLHMVRSKPPGEAPSAAPAAASAARSGGDAATPTPPAFGLGAQPQAGGQQQLLSTLLNMPQVQTMLQNPEVLRSMLNANPAIRQLMNQNPEMAHILNNPALLRESLALAANPGLMREQMRHSDRAMSNLEAHPEGFNALRRMYENIQAPLQNATSGENAAAANPFAALLPQQPAGAGGQGGGDSSPGGGTTPNTAPLPNPWAPNAGSAAAGGRPAAAAPGNAPPDLGMLGALGSLGGLGGGGGDLSQLDSPAAREAVLQMLGDPGYRQAMGDFMASDAGQAAVRGMAQSHPQLRALLDANPMMRDIFNDPERLRRMLAPESVQAMMGLRQNMDQLQQLMGLGGAAGGAAGGMGGVDMGALAGMLGGDLGALGGGGVPPVANPEEAYAAQLTQLQEMGFFDRQANIQALQRTGGNVQAAVDRLLNQP